MLYCLNDPGLKGPGMPRTAFRLHRRFSPRYEKWARRRIESGLAKELSLEEVAATEWPVFGSAFYLWATEALQEAWEQDNSFSAVSPQVYAAGAIEAAAELVTDPGHASWVKEHWGERYLHKENVFYRMLLIGGMTSYHKLLGGEKYLGFLRDQVEGLSKELDESRYGLLDDYPGQCYPTDVVAAIACIKRADEVLGTNHTEFVERAVRGFEGDLVDWTGLPPYGANSRTGVISIARGCSSQWMTIWAPELWPERASEWYESFEKHFWQRRWTAAGFREFPKGTGNSEWYMDVDSGPVGGGYGAAASAFGIGAARANGRFDHAYPLSIEVLLACWPLPNGTLFVARFLSNAAHAQYLGEAGLLYALTRMPIEGFEVTEPGRLPVFVYLALCLYLGTGIFFILAAAVCIKRLHRQASQAMKIPFEKVQLVAWLALVIGGLVMMVLCHLVTGLLIILFAQFLPRHFRKRAYELKQVPASA